MGILNNSPIQPLTRFFSVSPYSKMNNLHFLELPFSLLTLNVKELDNFCFPPGQIFAFPTFLSCYLHNRAHPHVPAPWALILQVKVWHQFYMKNNGLREICCGKQKYSAHSHPCAYLSRAACPQFITMLTNFQTAIISP